jgi:hypothetical protein
MYSLCREARVADAGLLRRRVRGRTAAGAAAGKMESEVLWGPVQRRDVRSWWREGREVGVRRTESGRREAG